MYTCTKAIYLTTEFASKKVVLVAVPGAFTPTCQQQHVPSYLAKLPEFKSKGVDQIVFIASNDAWVMAAWGKANGVKDESIVSDIPCPSCSLTNTVYRMTDVQ